MIHLNQLLLWPSIGSILPYTRTWLPNNCYCSLSTVLFTLLYHLYHIHTNLHNNTKMNIQQYESPERNQNNGWFHRGKGFTTTKWLELLDQYHELVLAYKYLTKTDIANKLKISITSVTKLIDMYNSGGNVPDSNRGHGIKGVGSLIGFRQIHHDFIYTLFLENPSRPREGYVEELEKEFGITVSKSFITKWFKHIGKYKGTMRQTSKFPQRKFTEEIHAKLECYIDLIRQVDDHCRLVFADEKPMKEIDIYGKIRRDPITGDVYSHVCNGANVKNRFNILAAVSVKEDVDYNCEHLILEETANAMTFQYFVKHLCEIGFLRENDIFIVDNCTIHMQGDNIDLPDVLWEVFRIVMIPLPPYYAELNPTEFVFNYLVSILKRDRARYISDTNELFVNKIGTAIDSISRNLIVKEYKHCGYLK